MAVRTSHEPGSPSWVDIGTPDLEGQIAFYSGLLGWDVEIGPPEMGRYSMATIGGKPVAALADQQTPGMPVFWATYVTVVDVDESTKKAQDAGGTVVVAPMDVMEFGRMAVIQDPGGAFLSLWQAGSHIGAELVNEPGALCWNELMTRHVDEAFAFYAAVFGWTSMKVGPDGMDYYELALPDGTSVGGLMPMIGDMWPPEIPDHWMVYFAVQDADATAAKAVELGGSVSVAPTDIPPGRFAVLNDPRGAVFSVLAFKEALRG